MKSLSFTFEPIGFIESCYKERFGTPRQPNLAPDSWAVLSLRPELNLQEALEGLEGFSHLWLIFVFHLNTNKNIKAKVHPPRLDGDKIGLFATRTPHRPNPIGLSAVKIEKVEGSKIYLSGVDLVDGTPILDIKPYLRSSDCIVDAKDGWTSARQKRELRVKFSTEALQNLFDLRSSQNGDDTSSVEKLKNLIIQTIQLDPRPNFYKGTPENPNPYMDVYGFRIEELNILFKVNGDEATVVGAERCSE